ncbi:DUF4328 domain-containing protein [Streptomyces sp. CBMA123]|uniref:DUF4328 domain-containing protein n=1 Tax=Streptomyces sp. CBMA123 TaxID=1896313 RepID=UPI0016619C14|nr:DUF4328 domain-containing protein [Streptomyces sp. CBMA123]MBD0694056.1 hypothetical protein [Streptomyces sp. CBMA123]
MVCLACGTRPAGTDSGRCFGCAEAAPGWAAALNPANGLATAVSVLLGLNAAMAAVLVTIDVWSNVLTGRLLDGADDVGAEDFAPLKAVANALNGVLPPVALATVVVFIIWFHRTRKNADLLAPNGHRMGRGWTIGAWFTPIAQLWIPWQLMADCWRASAPLDPEGRRRPPSEAVLAVWWSTFVGSLVLGRVAATMTRHVGQMDSIDLENLRTGVWVEAGGAALRLVAAIAAILVVRRLTSMQRTRRADINLIAARAAQEARVKAVVSPTG